MRGHIILSHGSDSGPDATKVSVLAGVAETLGFSTQRPDYRADDALGHAGSVAPRVARLLAAIEAAPQPPILVGSSMGAFVSGLASLERAVRALFLLALPVAIPGVAAGFDLRRGLPAMLVHGYDDEVCPADLALAFAAGASMPALLVSDDHRLGAHVPLIAEQFRVFLNRLPA
jgi:pimeloyl-ACP methyl ester carboxylesterase